MLRKCLMPCLLMIFNACDGQVTTSAVAPFQISHPDEFAKYWYEGKAEINHYNLEQSRYDEVRHGDAILIYVTEDFLLENQVKREFGAEESVSILKLNYLKKFITGVYDYSIMTSIFTPIKYRENPATLKATFTAQDWCGQSFSQINLKDKKLNYQIRSYFQAEGDADTAIPATYIEEDIWTRMRIEPQMLPLGKIDIVPSQEYLRLYHKELKPYSAIATLLLQINENKSGGKEFYVYTLKYPELNRELRINCESHFPFKILEWEEKLSGNNSSKLHVTTARLTDSRLEPYWQQNTGNDEALRDSLGLRYIMKK